MNEARLIAAGKMTLPVDLVRQLHLDDSWLGFFMPLGFAPSKQASMHPMYPAGLPFHLALFGKAGGWKHAPYYVTPLAAIGCALFMFAIGRTLELSPFASIAGAASLCLLPPFLWHAVQPASDVLATFWTLVAIFCALRAVDRPSLAFTCGVAFAISVWVRPTNVLLMFALALAMRLRVRLLAFAAAGALPLALPLMWWNATLYGSPARTGYGRVDLSWDGVRNAAPQYVEWLAKFLTPLAFPGGLVVLFDRAIEKWTRWMIVAWFIPYIVFYSFYGFFDGWICIRFVLPAIPALIFGALLLIRRIEQPAIAVVLMLCMVAAPMYWTNELYVYRDLKTVEEGYPRHVKWAESHLPKRAVVITGVLSGAFLLYANRSIARYDQLNDDRFQILRAYAANAGLPFYVVVPDSELDYAALQKRFRGNWTFVDRLDDVNIYRLD